MATKEAASPSRAGAVEEDAEPTPSKMQEALQKMEANYKQQLYRTICMRLTFEPKMVIDELEHNANIVRDHSDGKPDYLERIDAIVVDELELKTSRGEGGKSNPEEFTCCFLCVAEHAGREKIDSFVLAANHVAEVIAKLACGVKLNNEKKLDTGSTNAAARKELKGLKRSFHKWKGKWPNMIRHFWTQHAKQTATFVSDFLKSKGKVKEHAVKNFFSPSSRKPEMDSAKKRTMDLYFTAMVTAADLSLEFGANLFVRKFIDALRGPCTTGYTPPCPKTITKARGALVTARMHEDVELWKKATSAFGSDFASCTGMVDVQTANQHAQRGRRPSVNLGRRGG